MDAVGLRDRWAWLAHALGLKSNPVRRRVDRLTGVSMLLLLVIGLLALPASAAFGYSVYQQQSQAVARESAERYQAVAVVTSNAQPRTLGGSPEGENTVTEAPAKWTDRHGQDHTGVVVVPVGTVQGSPLTVWLGPSGAVVPAPSTQAAAVATAVVEAVVALAAVEMCCLLLAVGVRALADVYACRAWGREWEIVERRWAQPH